MNPHALLREATGIDLGAEVVERALRERMDRLGLAERGAYLALLGGAELHALVDHVVVPESWMFRNAEAFDAAVAWVLRCLAAQPARQLRILSLPCAGGEEPYSLAMALDRAGIAPGACAIDAMDVSAAAIARARAGRYTRNAFRGRDLAFRDRYFQEDGGEYHLDARIRERVGFSQANLLAPGFARQAGQYDLVFCRNLLIYFDEATVARAVAALDALLARDGILFTGYAELAAVSRHGFAPLPLPGAFAMCRSDAPSPFDAPARRARRRPATPGRPQ